MTITISLTYRARKILGTQEGQGAKDLLVFLGVKSHSHDIGRIIGWEDDVCYSKGGSERCFDVPIYEHGSWGDPWARPAIWGLRLAAVGGVGIWSQATTAECRDKLIAEEGKRRS